MSTGLKIGVLPNNQAPVTLAEAVYIGDGTNNTLKDVLNNTGSSANNGTNIKYVNDGSVIFRVNLSTREVNFSDGSITLNESTANITSGVLKVSNTEWNPFDATTPYYFCYNTSSSAFEWVKSITSYDGYVIFQYARIDGYKINNLFYPQEKIIDISLPEDTLTYKSKRIDELTILGDSLSSAGVWLNHLTKRLPSNVVNNLAQHGISLVQTLTQKVPHVPSTTSLCIIFLGTNDCQAQISLGEINSKDTSTFIGAYNAIIETLLTLNPKMRILLLTPIRTWDIDSTTRTNDNLKGYVNATKKVGEKYALPVLDLFNTMGINDINKESYLGADLLHLNGEGQKYLSNLIYEFVNYNI